MTSRIQSLERSASSGLLQELRGCSFNPLISATKHKSYQLLYLWENNNSTVAGYKMTGNMNHSSCDFARQCKRYAVAHSPPAPTRVFCLVLISGCLGPHATLVACGKQTAHLIRQQVFGVRFLRLKGRGAETISSWNTPGISSNPKLRNRSMR